MTVEFVFKSLALGLTVFLVYLDWQQRASALERRQGQLERRPEVDLQCPYCHDRLEHADTALCQVCSSPHHEDCFLENAGCALYGCDSTQTRGKVGHAVPEVDRDCPAG